MAVEQRFRITVFSGSYVRKGPLGAFTSIDGEVVHDGSGSAQLVIPASHRRAGDLAADGARALIEYRPGTDYAWSDLMSGRVTEVDGSGSRRQPTRTFNIVDDYSALTSEILCWPNPTGAITAQGDDAAYFTKTGPAETVLKQILAPNVARDGIVLTIPTSLGRGSTITCAVRMHYVTERIMPMFEDAGLGVRVIQSGTSRTLDVFQPKIHSRVLTEGSGIVTDVAYSMTPPTVTRVIVGTSGQGTDRHFAQDIAGTVGSVLPDVDLEGIYKVKLPRFVDARDLDAAADDYDDLLTQRIKDAYSEGSAKASLSATLVETGKFRFKVAYDVGDTFPIQPAGGPVITDVVRSVGFKADTDGGVVITPKVGDWQDSVDVAVINQVADLVRSVSDLQKR